MIGNNQFRTFYPGVMNNDNTAKQLKQYVETTNRRKQMGLENDGVDAGSFAAKLKQADENLASGESFGATDSIGIILRQMGEPQAGASVTKTVIHNGVTVSVTKDALHGNSITIGGSANPDWIQAHTSVGTVNIDLNDMESLMKCLDMFSPEDINAILRKITEVKQARDAMQELDNMKNQQVERAEDTKEEDEE